MKTSDFLKEWLNDERYELQLSTYEAYTVYINRHIIPYFEKHAPVLEELTARDIKDYINYIKVSGRHDGKKGGLSHASVKKHLSVIKQALNEAVILGYINNNPALSIKLKRERTVYSPKTVMLTTEDAQRLIDCFKGHILYPAVVLALYYGLRRSEVLGLRWSAIDFEHNEMRIEHTVVKNLTIEAKDCTKTACSKAVYQLFPEVREMLLKLKATAPKNSEYILVWPDGRMLRPDFITKSFQKHLVKSGLPKMRFHDLRHSTASILFDKGLELENVKNWLRHSDIETTSNIYLHYGRGRNKLAYSAINGMFKI